MKQRFYNILFVEDDLVDQKAFRRFVQDNELPYQYEIFDTTAEALQALEANSYDIVLSDYQLADGTAQTILSCKNIPPVIVITGMGDESIAVNALKSGAVDYLIKDSARSYLAFLPPIIEKAVKEREREYQLEAAQKELVRAHDDMRAILDQLQIGIIMLDGDNRITFMNRVWEAYFDNALQKTPPPAWDDVASHFSDAVHEAAAQASSLTEAVERTPVHFESPMGNHYWMEMTMRKDPRHAAGKILFFYDATEIHILRRNLENETLFFGMIGRSSLMQKTFQFIREIAKVDWTCLIEGETGTGKELAAKAIHLNSDRKDRPFIPFNCAGFSETLIGSQLFGHKKGAFTGAISDQRGLFETAQGGTLFLDEIGDIPISHQAALLRVLQEKEITRIGETTPRKIDVRVLAATHLDLKKEMAQGRFRADLYYRLQNVRLALPRLIERIEDIPVLIEFFLEESRKITRKKSVSLSQKAMGRLMQYTWPGNVRELKSAIEYSVLRCNGSIIKIEDLPSELVNSGVHPGLKNERFKLDGEDIKEALKRTNGNRTEAAKLLGMSRATFYRRIKDLKLT